MFITELFAEAEETQKICLTDLSHIPHKYAGVIQRLAKFHRIGLEYDPETHKWFADDTAGINPFMKDVKHITSAAGMGNTMHEDGSDTGRKLIAIFRKEHPHHSKIYLWKTGPGTNTFEMEVGQDRKRIPVTLSLAQIKQVLGKKGFNESVDVTLGEASMTKSVPSKKEGVFNKGVEKSLGQQVAVIVLDHPDSVAYGKFVRIGETGLCHIKLNGGKLPGSWASGDMIAVRPSEVYSTWDPRLQGKTAVHREYK